MHILCFDYGTKYIGVAEAKDQATIAQAIDPIVVGRSFSPVEKIKKVIKRTCPDTIVIGNPTGLDGKPTQISLVIERIAEQLEQEMHIPIKLWNETYTSKEASRKRDIKDRRIHSEAARIILQEYLDFLKTGI